MTDKDTGALYVRIDRKIKADLLVVGEICGLSLVKVMESMATKVMYGVEDLHWNAIHKAILINRRVN